MGLLSKILTPKKSTAEPQPSAIHESTIMDDRVASQREKLAEYDIVMSSVLLHDRRFERDFKFKREDPLPPGALITDIDPLKLAGVFDAPFKSILMPDGLTMSDWFLLTKERVSFDKASDKLKALLTPSAEDTLERAFTAPEMKQMCIDRGLKATGSKKDMSARLVEVIGADEILRSYPVYGRCAKTKIAHVLEAFQRAKRYDDAVAIGYGQHINGDPFIPHISIQLAILYPDAEPVDVIKWLYRRIYEDMRGEEYYGIGIDNQIKAFKLLP